MMTRRILQLLAVLAALLIPMAAMAQGPVNALLQGPPIDAYATTLNVAPPKGTTVMITRGGKAVSFLSRAGQVPMQRNATYGITVIKGKTMIFNQGLVARPGNHTLSWQDGNPTLTYTPFVVVRGHGHARGGRYGRADHGYRQTTERAPQPRARQRVVATRAAATLSESRFERIYRYMLNLPSDQLRLNVLAPWTQRASFSSDQAEDLKSTFVSHAAIQRADRMLTASAR